MYNSLFLPIFDYCDVCFGQHLNHNCSTPLKYGKIVPPLLTAPPLLLSSSSTPLLLLSSSFPPPLLLLLLSSSCSPPSVLLSSSFPPPTPFLLLLNRQMMCALPIAKTEFLKKSFANVGAKLWNDLPVKVQMFNSVCLPACLPACLPVCLSVSFDTLSKESLLILRQVISI